MYRSCGYVCRSCDLYRYMCIDHVDVCMSCDLYRYMCIGHVDMCVGHVIFIDTCV